MKRSIQVSALIIFAFLVFVPPAAFSEVKISLKNGRDIIADSCREAKDKLICEKVGGTFEFDKKDIRDVKKVTIKHEEIHESVPEPVPVEEVREEAVKSTDETPKPKEGVLIKGANPEQEKRLDQINQRKLELKVEREQLSKEREQLNQDIKETGMVYTQEQLDRLTKSISDVEGRINRFNEEVKKLNAEEAGIIEELNKRE
jgi:hypothetical protein